jgi:hypothetical protein
VTAAAQEITTTRDHKNRRNRRSGDQEVRAIKIKSNKRSRDQEIKRARAYEAFCPDQRDSDRPLDLLIA